MSCFYLISNWKMNGSDAELSSFLRDSLCFSSPALKAVICPPFPFLQETSRLLPQSYCLGAQDCSAFEDNTRTGQVSAFMLKSVGCSYVIIGHCERRIFEPSEEILLKKKQAQKAGIIPIVCVGEEDSQEWEKTLKLQIEGLAGGDFLLAYEPVWAVGKNIPFHQEHVEKVFRFLTQAFPDTPVLYGGAVTSADLEKIRRIGFSGVLLGRAGRDVHQWNAVVDASLKYSAVD